MPNMSTIGQKTKEEFVLKIQEVLVLQAVIDLWLFDHMYIYV